MIEFDVLAERRDGSGRAAARARLRGRRRRRTPHTLDEGLAHFAGAAYDGVELDVDLKCAGYEERVVEALREHGLVERSARSRRWRSRR